MMMTETLEGGGDGYKEGQLRESPETDIWVTTEVPHQLDRRHLYTECTVCVSG